MVLDRIAAANGLVFTKGEFQSVSGSWKIDGETVLLVKPQTYMNQCGLTVKELLEKTSLDVEDLVVVHDDLDLPFGRIRIRSKGASAGHRGIQSILEVLETESFFRVRVGIGRPPPGLDPSDFVLDRFSEEQVVVLNDVLNNAANAVTSVLRDGPRQAMEQFNRRE
jgi:PTH1 family peptidyl-tRNA hydrolase